MTPTATNAGKKHRPVGNSNRIESLAADCSIRARSSQSNCSMATSRRFTGDVPFVHEDAKASRTTARSPSSGHASFQETPSLSRSPAERRPSPNSPETMPPTAINACGMDDPCRMATLSISRINGSVSSCIPESASGGTRTGTHRHSHAASAAHTAAININIPIMPPTLPPVSTTHVSKSRRIRSNRWRTAGMAIPWSRKGTPKASPPCPRPAAPSAQATP